MSFTMDVEMAERIESHRKRLAERGGVPVSTAVAVRQLVERALHEAERNAGRRR